MRKIKAYCEGKFGQIHYATCGTGTPLVLLHQGPTSIVQFHQVFGLLADRGFKVIAIDLPGYGGSDGPDHPPTVSDYAHIVPAVLDALGITQAHLLGHHTGAIIATEVALQYCDRINRLILNGPLPLTDEERAFFKQILAQEREWRPQSDGSHLTAQWGVRIGAQPGWSDLDAIHRNVVAGAASWPDTWYAHNAVMAYDHEVAMSRISQPCLIMSNTGDGIHYLAERAAQMFPRFNYLKLEGGTFDIIDEQPEAWSDMVAGWLSA